MAAFLDDVVDVSDAQGAVDWQIVAAAGIRVAFIKATEGHTFEARNFLVNRESALATGLITVIPYDFLRPGYAPEQLAFFSDIAGLGAGSLSMLDWEGRAADTCTPDEADAIGNGIFAATGRYPIGYWGMDGATPRPPTADMKTWPRCVPRYPKQVAAFVEFPTRIKRNPLLWWPHALFAQYTSHGIVNGISGPVDRSVWIGSAAERAAFLRDGTMPLRG